MAQHDYNLANQSGADFRADLNNALSAIVTVNSGATAPSTTFSHQLWVDTSSNVLKIRNAANDAWVTTGVSITADNTFAGNLTGNVTGNLTGDVTGNADTATALATARTINGASFDGTANISFGTDSVSEGSSNLYFTNARVESYLDAGTATPTFASAIINTSITGTAILDDDTFGTASATTVSTSESIKAYVDSQIGSVDTLAEILANGNTTGGTDIAFGDNDKATFGNSDLLIYHDGSNSFITDGGTGDLKIRSNKVRIEAPDSQNMIIITEDAGFSSYYNGTKRLEVTNTGIDVTGTVKASTSLMVGSTDAPARDLEIKTTNPHIRLTDTDASGGYTEIFGGSGITTINADKGQAVAGSALKLSVDATDGLTIDSNHNVDIPNGNLDVTGTVTSDGLTSLGDTQVISFASDSGYLKITNNIRGGDYRIATSGTTAQRLELKNGNSQKLIRFADNGDISFYDDTGTSQGLFWDASAEKLGIGTTSPSEKLTVAGIVKSNGLSTNTAGVSNFIAGVNAGSSIISGGEYNTLIGDEAGASITTGDFNVAVGTFSLDANTTAGENTAIGYASLSNNITGARNVASGFRALQLNTAANDNTATGYFSLYSTTGSNNTAIGKDAGKNITTGSKNTIIGSFDGNQGGLDIRTANNHIVLSDGDGNPRQVIDSSGNVGIGTTSPSVPLHVYHATDNKLLTLESGDSTSTFELKDNQGTALVQSFNGVLNLVSNNTGAGSNQIRFSNGATEIARFNGSNLGIGTTSPQRQLHIVGSNVAAGIRLEADTAADATLELLAFDGNNTASIKTLGGNDALVLGTAGTEALRIDSSQRVGIGTGSPNAKLTVQNGIQRINSTDGSSDARIQFSMTDGSDIPTAWVGIPSWNKDAFYIFAPTATGNESAAFYTNANWVFQTGGTEALRIDSSQNVGIGTSSPTSPLTVKSNSTGSQDAGFTLQANGSTNAIFKVGEKSNGKARLHMFDGTTEKIALHTDGTASHISAGNFGIGTNAPGEKLTVSGNTLAYGSTGNVGAGASYFLGNSQNSRDIALTRVDSATLAIGYYSGGWQESARFDSSGNFLVSTSSTSPWTNSANSSSDNGIALRNDGIIAASAYKGTAGSGNVAILNRTGTDGGILSFYRSGTAVGSIGTQGGNLFIENGNVGLLLNDTTDELRPAGSGGVPNDNVVSLGASAKRFKDLHLSGTANTGGLSVNSGTTDTVATFQSTDQFSDIKLQDSGGSSFIRQSNGSLIFEADRDNAVSGSAVLFKVDGSNVGRFDTSGNLLVGKTAVSIGAVGIEVKPFGEVRCTASEAQALQLNRLSTDGTIIDFRKDSATVGSISVTSSATAYNTSSDARLKDVTGEARGLEVITKLNPVAYNWKADGKADEGLIAQEVKELVPNAVTGSEDEHYQMDYSKLVTHLVKAVQELEKQTIELKEEIANLKGE